MEIIRLIEEGIPCLERKVEFLATGVYNSEHLKTEDNEIAIDCFKKASRIFPEDTRLQKALTSSLSIIDEQVNKKKALRNLDEIRSILVSLLKELKSFMLKSPRVTPTWKSRIPEVSRLTELNIEAKDMIDKAINILEEILKNDEEYKLLLERKNSGENVEDLIKENRQHAEILKKKDKEHSEKALKWGKSKEGINYFKYLEQIMRFGRNSRFKLETGLELTKKIKNNDEEYEQLLERRKNGEYVDDLINQNRYNAKSLEEQLKKVWEDR
ncbi:MAG: hypothetical protein ACFE94_19940 [Candidatus Hodarchaeota archaeon]